MSKEAGAQMQPGWQLITDGILVIIVIINLFLTEYERKSVGQTLLRGNFSSKD